MSAKGLDGYTLQFWAHSKAYEILRGTCPYKTFSITRLELLLIPPCFLVSMKKLLFFQVLPVPGKKQNTNKQINKQKK